MEFITAYDAFNKQRQIHFEVINQELDKIISEIDQTIQNNPKDNHIIVNYKVSEMVGNILIDMDYKVWVNEYSDRDETRISWQS